MNQNAKTTVGLAAIAAGALLAGCATTRGPVMAEKHDRQYEDLDAIVEQGIADKLYPGAVLIIGKPGRILHAKSYGTRTFADNAAPVRLDTIFDLASVSKVVGTGTASFVLMQEGKLAPQDKVSYYIAGWDDEQMRDVRVADLMTHTSGLKAYESRDLVEESRAPGETTADALIRHYAALLPSYEPRTDYVYSCLNFQTLARVNEQAGGKRLDEVLRPTVWQPLGMNDTAYELTGEQLSRVAPTHRLKDGQDSSWQVHDPLANYHGSWSHCPGNAGLFSTGPDLARYCEMILNDGMYRGYMVLSPTLVQEATSVQTPVGVAEKRGYAFDVYEDQPYTTALNNDPETYVVGHTGYTGTMIWLDKKSDTYFVFLTNRTYPADPEATDQASDIRPIRKAIAEKILKSQPQYAQFYGIAPNQMTAAAGQ